VCDERGCARSRRLTCLPASIVNAAGYVGAIVSPYIVSEIVPADRESDATAWAPVFILLACLTLVTAAANGVYWYLDVADQDRQAVLDPAERQSLLSKA
jgi:hypothetical protein